MSGAWAALCQHMISPTLPGLVTKLRRGVRVRKDEWLTSREAERQRNKSASLLGALAIRAVTKLEI